MQVAVLLADSAQTDPLGKVHALGLGWSWTSFPTAPAAVVVLIKVPWTATNQRHHFALRLVSDDGEPVRDAADRPLLVEGDFEVGRPAGIPHGMAIDQAFAVTVPAGLPVEAAHMYEWRLEIDGSTEDSWRAAFYVKAPQG